MKSLKRTLCLVLALVMVLGLFGIASASSFTDDNAIQYKEAVDVMTAIGAINGYNDGSFGPKGTITRAEAAKLVTYTVLGKAAADSLTGVSSSFTDVTVAGGYGWAIPSIEFLVKSGVINGMGDGTFDPAGNISGYAVLKMLLCALGYGAKGEYVGNQWDLNVAIAAGKAKLTAGSTNTGALSAPATREEVALYCLNTIQRPMVEYVSTLDVYINADGGLTGGTAKTIMGTVYPQLTVKTAAAGGKDAMGAPANEWYYKGKEIGAYVVAAALTYTTAQTEAALTAALKSFSINPANVTDGNGNVVNPKGVAISLNGKDDSSAADRLTIADVVAALQPLTGNGTVVNVYVSDVGQLKTITVVKSDVAKVASVGAVSGVSMTIQSAVKSYSSVTDASYTINPTNDLYASVSGLKKDDIVVVTPVWNPAVSAYVAGSVSVPTQVTGKLTDIGTVTVNGQDKNASVTIGGKTYPIAADATAALAGLALTSVADKDNCTIYVDALGNAVDYKGATPTTNYLYVTRIDNTLVDGIIVKVASGYAPDGSLVKLNIGTVNDTTSDAYKDAICSYVPAQPNNSDSAEYTLTAATQINGTTAAVGEYAPNNAAIAPSMTSFVGDKSSGGTLSVPFAPDVKFIYVKDGKPVVVRDGVQKIENADEAKALFTKDPTDATKVVVSVVYVTVEPVDTMTNLVFLAKLNGSTGVDDNTVYNYTAVIDGVPANIQTKSHGTSNDGTAVPLSVGAFYEYSKDAATGLYTLDTTAYIATSAAVSVKVGLFSGLQAGYILSVTNTGGAQSGLNALNAQILDLTGDGLTTLASIAQAAKEKNVTLAVIFDGDSTSATANAVKYIYVLKAEQPTVTFADKTSGGITITVTCEDDNGEDVTSGSKVAMGTKLTFTFAVEGDATNSVGAGKTFAVKLNGADLSLNGTSLANCAYNSGIEIAKATTATSGTFTSAQQTVNAPVVITIGDPA